MFIALNTGNITVYKQTCRHVITFTFNSELLSNPVNDSLQRF